MGDRFTHTGNDQRARYVAMTVWVTNPQETGELLMPYWRISWRVCLSWWPSQRGRPSRTPGENSSPPPLQHAVHPLALTPSSALCMVARGLLGAILVRAGKRRGDSVLRYAP